MAKIEWDLDEQRTYEAGLDHGVIYPNNGVGVPWNGLINVTSRPSQDTITPLYYEGLKFDILDEKPERTNTVTAYTYPEELDELVGYHTDTFGLTYADQSRGFFSLSYRTMVNEGQDYKLHIFFNQKAAISEIPRQTITDSLNAVTFGWELTGLPVEFNGAEMTYLILDSRHTSPAVISAIEKALYGSESVNSNFERVIEILNNLDELVASGDWYFVQQDDGIWTLVGPNNGVTYNDGLWTVTNLDNVTDDGPKFSIKNLKEL